MGQRQSRSRFSAKLVDYLHPMGTSRGLHELPYTSWQTALIQTTSFQLYIILAPTLVHAPRHRSGGRVTVANSEEHKTLRCRREGQAQINRRADAGLPWPAGPLLLPLRASPRVCVRTSLWLCEDLWPFRRTGREGQGTRGSETVDGRGRVASGGVAMDGERIYGTIAMRKAEPGDKQGGETHPDAV